MYPKLVNLILIAFIRSVNVLESSKETSFKSISLIDGNFLICPITSFTTVPTLTWPDDVRTNLVAVFGLVATSHHSPTNESLLGLSLPILTSIWPFPEFDDHLTYAILKRLSLCDGIKTLFNVLIGVLLISNWKI